MLRYNKLDKDKEYFQNSLIIFLCTFLLLIMALVIPHDHHSYYKVHSGLLTISILDIGFFIVSRDRIFRIIRILFRKNRKLNLQIGQIGDIIMLITHIIVLISILFVIDLDFLSNYKFKIGTVVVITIVNTILFYRSK